MNRRIHERLLGIAAVLVAASLWGTTGTAATFAPEVGAVAIYPLAFYASMRLAGVTIGTVVSIGSAPLLSALIETRLEGLRLTRRWRVGAGLGLAVVIVGERLPAMGWAGI
ncbi:MAG: EamA family transporter, partial [Halomonas sp.]